MNIKQLKKMISEEYRYWLAEQPADTPGVEVGPNDIDAMGGGDDSEATLRQIFDMLKAYFEGSPAGGPAGMPAGMPAGDDMGDMGDMDAGDDMDMDAGDDMDDEEADDEDEEEALQERFKKLANIIKG